MPRRRLLPTLPGRHLGHGRADHVELEGPVGVRAARIHGPARRGAAAVPAAGTPPHVPTDVPPGSAKTPDPCGNPAPSRPPACPPANPTGLGRRLWPPSPHLRR